MTNLPQHHLGESSPAIQTHLSILQSLIQRMAGNSSGAKTSCITLVSAILVIVADKGKPNYAWISLIPCIMFMALDVYYLALEKGFRSNYNNFVAKLHQGTAMTNDLYLIIPTENQFKNQLESLKSFSIWGFYPTLFLLIVVARSIVIG